MAILNRFKCFLPIQTKILFYNSRVLSHLNFSILLCGSKCMKVFKLQKTIVGILSHSIYNAHANAIFKHLKLLKVCDILKLQELKFYYHYKNKKVPHYLQALPFHPNTRTHDHNTEIKDNIHHPNGKHDFTKHCVPFDIPRIDCPNSVLDTIVTHSLHDFSGYIKAHCLNAYQEDCTIVDCYVCKN